MIYSKHSLLDMFGTYTCEKRFTDSSITRVEMSCLSKISELVLDKGIKCEQTNS